MAQSITSIITARSLYPKVLSGLQSCSEAERTARLRNLCRTDLYFLLRYGCGRADLDRDWVFDRCREVQDSPDGMLDLWAREHYKSTIITFGLTILEILASHGDDPIVVKPPGLAATAKREPAELTFGIFSHTRPIAKGFLRQIKYEFEANENLQRWFPDVLWADPKKESPKWSEDDGIIVKRKSNPKEATVEAWGLVDGQPTSKHFPRRIYDDIVVEGSVTSPDMMGKTTKAFELSDSLGTEGGTFRIAGTRYHFSDTYGEIVKRKAAVPRVHPCTRDGSENFTPDNCVLMNPETLTKKRITQGPHTFGTQMLLNPRGDSAQGFDDQWIKFSYSEPVATGMNVYILCDPANEKRKTSDYTTFWVIGLGADQNYVALDVVRDRFNLTERTEVLFDLHRHWRPKGVGYEKYGMQADIEHIKSEQERRNYRFEITELGGQTPKLDRIRKLIPLFEQGRIYLRRSKTYTNYEDLTQNLIEVFIEEEYKAFPVMSHDDMLDCLARIVDPDLRVEWPREDQRRGPPQTHAVTGSQSVRPRPQQTHARR